VTLLPCLIEVIQERNPSLDNKKVLFSIAEVERAFICAVSIEEANVPRRHTGISTDCLRYYLINILEHAALFWTMLMPRERATPRLACVKTWRTYAIVNGRDGWFTCTINAFPIPTAP
jgi:hypothetical protein